MADFYSTKLEENLIDSVIKDGLGYKNNDGLPKYYVLRIALARALHLDKWHLNSLLWESKRLGGERGKEYHLAQITGKGGERSDDIDYGIRAIFYVRHKDELESDIFNDEKLYLEILRKYIQRGLYELRNSWKNRDSFYQWLLDNLEYTKIINNKNIPIKSPYMYFDKIEQYFKKEAIVIKKIDEFSSYRHQVCKIEVQDSTKIEHFKRKIKNLDDELGASTRYQLCVGQSKIYNIEITKPEKEWINPDISDFKNGLKILKEQNYNLGIFIGMSVEKKPVCIDLTKSPHIFVGGATGSGKSVLLQSFIISILQNKNAEMILIDPKQGGDFKEFETRIQTIYDMKEANNILDSLIDEMELRYKENNIDMSYKVLMIDELNDLIIQDKNINDKLARLAIKARAANIHLILGTQRPDSKIFSGQLRSNIPTRIALKVQKSTESKIILDDIGAEKLLGTGDILLSHQSSIERLIGIKLDKRDIKGFL